MSVEATPGGVRLRLHVQPGAASSAIVGFHGALIKVRLAAPPIEGRANSALIFFLAEKLGVSRDRVALVRGAGSRGKSLIIQGIGVDEVLERLGLPRG